MGEAVAPLAGVKPARPARNNVRHVVFAQLFFQGARLKIGAIQHGAVPEAGAPAVNGTDNVAGNGLGLVRLVPVFNYADFLVGPKIAPQVIFKLAPMAAEYHIDGR